MRAVTVSVALAVVGLAGAAAVLAGDEPRILGKEAPAIETKEWLNSDGRTAIADFKGELLFIELFSTD